MDIKLENIKDQPSCMCDTCKSMCKRPCWGTPTEIKKLIENDYGHYLMVDYWVGDSELRGDIQLLCGAWKGYGKIAPYYENATCRFFLDNSGECMLHILELKPIEGRVASCNRENNFPQTRYLVAKSWDTEEGRNLVKLWKDKYLYE